MQGQNEDNVIDHAIQILKGRVFRSTDVIKDQHDLRRYLGLRYSELEYEVFGSIFLNSINQVVGMETLFRGSLRHTSVYPREVIKSALKYNASAAIFYHNHPSGSAEPSTSDISLTKRLGNVLKLIDVDVLDHIVIAGTSSTSFSEIGIMPAFDVII